MANKNPDVIGHCGKEGRVARAQLRNGEIERSNLQHLHHCVPCQAKIEKAILNNPKTTYIGESVSEAIDTRIIQRRGIYVML